MGLKIDLVSGIGLVCSLLVGWHFYGGWGLLMALAVYGLLK